MPTAGHKNFNVSSNEIDLQCNSEENFVVMLGLYILTVIMNGIIINEGFRKCSNTGKLDRLFCLFLFNYIREGVCITEL